jgi:hypothetical protein
MLPSMVPLTFVRQHEFYNIDLDAIYSWIRASNQVSRLLYFALLSAEAKFTVLAL